MAVDLKGKNAAGHALVMLVLAVVILGTTGLFVVRLNFSSEEIVVVRTGLGALFLGAVSILGHTFDGKAWKQDVFPATLGGIAIALNWLFLFEAYKDASVSVAILLCYCGPMVVLLLSPMFFHEPLGRGILIAAFIVAVGMFCITGTESFHSSGDRGMIFALVSGGFYALLLICNKSIKAMTSLHCTLYQLVIATVVMCVVTVVLKGTFPIHMPHGSEWFYVFMLGIVNTGIAYTLFFSAIKALPGQTVALLSYIEPLTALLLSALVLGERLLPLQLLGAVLILGGTAFGNKTQGAP